MANRIECRDLVVAYGDHVAADQISFDVGEGEVFGLLGPNGAGKTSVIRSLTTIIDPRAGSATIAGIPLEHHHEVRKRIGVLPESSGYPKDQTGRAYLTFYGQLFGLSRREAGSRADRLLDQFGLGSTRQHISQYSRGMRQRLGLCRALINDPDVLFLDEPTLGLDPAGKHDIVRHLADIASTNGTAVVLCTHLLDEVERACDRVAIMDRGQLVTQGTVDHVIKTTDAATDIRIRIDPADIPEATQALTKLAGVAAINFDNSRPGDIAIRIDPNGTINANDLLAVVLACDIAVRSFETQQATLNDAFLALTGGQP